MATRSKTGQGLTLEEFLRSPRINEKPYQEYIDGRIEVKVAAQKKHCVIQSKLVQAFDRFAEPARLGQAFPELRCTFAGRSILPDVTFLLDPNIETDANGYYVDETFIPPDIHVEIRSPEQSIKKTKEKLAHSVANGCPLGWFIDPIRLTIDVYRPGLDPERLAPDGFLDGSPVMPEFRLAVAEVFGWLIYRTQKPANPGLDPQ
jgi:Uma2 family endonuclease